MTKESDKNILWAHLAILLANISWGLMSPFSKDILISGTISPIALSGLRITGGALLFLVFSFILPKSAGTRQKIDNKDWLRMFFCSVLMISANQGLFIIGIGLTNPIDSSVMSAMTPILTMVLSAFLLKFPITWMKALGVGTGLTGALFLVAGTRSDSIAINPVLGDSLCFTAQLCAAIYYVVFRDIIKKYSPFTMMKWMFFISVVTYVPFCVPDILNIDVHRLPPTILLELMYIIFCATFLAYLCIPFSQRYLKPTMVSMYNYLQPVFAALMAVCIGVGGFSWLKGVATLLIFIGVYIVNKSSVTSNSGKRKTYSS